MSARRKPYGLRHHTWTDWNVGLLHGPMEPTILRTGRGPMYWATGKHRKRKRERERKRGKGRQVS